MRPRDPTCPLCIPDQLEPQLVAETRTFSLAADPRPLTEGHLLLLPREHLPCFAALAPDSEPELYELLGSIDALLAREIGPPAVLELATAASAHAHAHAHVLPNLPATPLAPSAARAVSGLADLASAWQRRGGYLFIWRREGGQAFPPEALPAPGLRTWLAQTLAAHGRTPPAEVGQPAARRQRRAWQRFQRDTGGPPQGIVTSFLRRDGRICLFKRSATLESAAGKWHAVSGYLPHRMDPLEQALEEILEETGLRAEQLALVRAGPPIPLGDPGERSYWLVYSFLFDLLNGEPRLNWEHQDLAWVDPADLARYNTVAWLPLVYHTLA